jgi:hypothetical protein
MRGTTEYSTFVFAFESNTHVCRRTGSSLWHGSAVKQSKNTQERPHPALDRVRYAGDTPTLRSTFD